jgi:hypothetical protein
MQALHKLQLIPPSLSDCLPVVHGNQAFKLGDEVQTCHFTFAMAFSMFSLGTPWSLAFLSVAASCKFILGSIEPPPTVFVQR